MSQMLFPNLVIHSGEPKCTLLRNTAGGVVEDIELLDFVGEKLPIPFAMAGTVMTYAYWDPVIMQLLNPDYYVRTHYISKIAQVFLMDEGFRTLLNDHGSEAGVISDTTQTAFQLQQVMGKFVSEMHPLRVLLFDRGHSPSEKGFHLILNFIPGERYGKPVVMMNLLPLRGDHAIHDGKIIPLCDYPVVEKRRVQNTLSTLAVRIGLEPGKWG